MNYVACAKKRKKKSILFRCFVLIFIVLKIVDKLRRSELFMRLFIYHPHFIRDTHFSIDLYESFDRMRRIRLRPIRCLNAIRDKTTRNPRSIWVINFLICIPQVYDILVVNQNYNGDGLADSLSLSRGDLVEVLDQKPINNGKAVDKDPLAKWVGPMNCFYPHT